jgi:ferredoxin
LQNRRGFAAVRRQRGSGRGRLTNGDHRSTTESELARAHVPARNRGRLIDYAETFQEHDFPPDKGNDAISGGKVGLQLARALPWRACARAGHDMVRCIFCGMCEEVCPEQAIYLRKDYAITGFTREDMMHHKDKLLEIGGVMHGVVLKWNQKK